MTLQQFQNDDRFATIGSTDIGCHGGNGRCSCSTDFLCFEARLIHGDYRRAHERGDASAMGRIEDAWTDHRRAAGCVTANAVRCIPRTDVDPYSPTPLV